MPSLPATADCYKTSNPGTHALRQVYGMGNRCTSTAAWGTRRGERNRESHSVEPLKHSDSQGALTRFLQIPDRALTPASQPSL